MACVKFAGNSLTSLRPAEISRAGIGFITENSNLFLGMTVHENLLLGAYSIRDRKQIDERLERPWPFSRCSESAGSKRPVPSAEVSGRCWGWLGP